MLPTLTVNRSFMQAFIAAETPCFALGLVEESGRPCGLIALRPDQEIPAAVTDGGFNFGHSLLGTAAFEVIHFAFEFYGFATYNVLINPNNSLVQAVLEHMIDDGDYFFFSLEESGRVTPFGRRLVRKRLRGSKPTGHASGNPPPPRRSTARRCWPSPSTRSRKAPCCTGYAGTLSIISISPATGCN